MRHVPRFVLVLLVTIASYGCGTASSPNDEATTVHSPLTVLSGGPGESCNDSARRFCLPGLTCVPDHPGLPGGGGTCEYPAVIACSEAGGQCEGIPCDSLSTPMVPVGTGSCAPRGYCCGSPD
jgi:hypothetical protein